MNWYSAALRLVVITPLMLGGRVVHAADEPWAQLQRCRTMVDGVQRLGCYDAIGASATSSVKGSAPVPDTAGVLHSAVSEPVAVTSPQAFGAEGMPRAPGVNAPADTLQARVLGHLEQLHKGSAVKLDNGQIWLCIDDRRYEDYEAETPLVTIERNFMGTYWLQVAGSSQKIKVRRIQ